MHWTTGAAVYSVHVLIAFGRVFSEINPGSKHTADIGVPFIKACKINYNCIFIHVVA